jgi:ATP-dependent RNA helicase DDX46/PRP5
MANRHSEKINLGLAKFHSGFGGRGLKRLEGNRDTIRKIQAVAHGAEDPVEEEVDPVTGGKKADPGSGIAGKTSENKTGQTIALKQATDVQAISTDKSIEKAIAAANDRAAKLQSMQLHERMSVMGGSSAASRNNAKVVAPPVRVQTDAKHWAEVEINDYPQQARWKVTSKEQIVRISGASNAAITSRGVYVSGGKQPPFGERKLYLVCGMPLICSLLKQIINIVLTERWKKSRKP